MVLLKCPHVQIAFFKFTSSDNQTLVGCIPVAAVAVHLNLESHSEFSRVNDNLNACTKKSGNLLNAPRIYSVYLSL